MIGKKMMFKKIQLGLLISCISLSSYAYVVQTNFTVENKTDVPMVISVDQPNGQGSNTLSIPAHESTQVQMQNGDSSGLLYQTATAPFTIKADGKNGKLVAQGRIAYYVGASMWNKYSFLDALSAAEGITIDPIYSCRNGGYGTTFDNRIILDGTPGNELFAKIFPREVKCQGLKSSEFEEHNGIRYSPTCFDGTSSTFTKTYEGLYCNPATPGICKQSFGYYDGKEMFFVEPLKDETALKAELIKKVGNGYCRSW
jgi:hypothetical protein